MAREVASTSASPFQSSLRKHLDEAYCDSPSASSVTSSSSSASSSLDYPVERNWRTRGKREEAYSPNRTQRRGGSSPECNWRSRTDRWMKKAESDTRPTSPLLQLSQKMASVGLGDSGKSTTKRLSPVRSKWQDEWTQDTNVEASRGPLSRRLSDEKCGDKRDFFFRHVDYATRCKLQIDDVASFSVTEVTMANKISKVLLELVDKDTPSRTQGDKCPLTITDGTACVGGNVLSFADHFQNVVAVENNSTRFDMLQNNLRVLDKDSNVVCHCASYLDIMKDVHQQVVFMDPPWGGINYKDQARIPLFLDDVPIQEICERLRHHTQWVALKVPTNFDLEAFEAHVTGEIIVRDDFRKMLLIVVDYRGVQCRTT